MPIVNGTAVSVTSSATSILTKDPDRKRVILTNLTSTPVYVGASGVTTTAYAWYLGANDELTLDVADEADEALFGITASGSASINAASVR